MSDVITTEDALVERIWEDYCMESVELSECFFTDIQVDMTKADLIRAYARIQMRCNGDLVVRLNNSLQICGVICDDYYPRHWEQLNTTCKGGEPVDRDGVPHHWDFIQVKGDANEILNAINEERLHGGPILGRICFDDEIRYIVKNHII